MASLPHYPVIELIHVTVILVNSQVLYYFSQLNKDITLELLQSLMDASTDCSIMGINTGLGYYIH